MISPDYQNTHHQTSDIADEISALDILRFLKGAYKTILVFGILGLVVEIAYLVITPNRFEAVAQIQMAQTIGANNNLNSLGVDVEEQAQSNPALATVQTIKLTPIKGVSGAVELKTVSPTPGAASICAQAIFELIKTSKAQILAPYLKEAQTQSAEYGFCLDQAKALVAKTYKSGAVIGAATHLSTRDEIKLLSDQVALLQDVISFNQSRVTRLVTPIYVSDNPVAPKKRIALLAGLLGGPLLGLLIALATQMWAKLEGQNNEAGKVL